MYFLQPANDSALRPEVEERLEFELYRVYVRDAFPDQFRDHVRGATLSRAQLQASIRQHALLFTPFSLWFNSQRYSSIDYMDQAVPQVPLWWFKDHLLPPLPYNLNLDSLIRELKDNGAIEWTKTRRNKKYYYEWADFKHKLRPSNGHEDDVAGAFERVAQKIGAAAATLLPDTEQHVTYKAHPAPNLPQSSYEGKPMSAVLGIYSNHHRFKITTPPDMEARVHWDAVVVSGGVQMHDWEESSADVCLSALVCQAYILTR